MDSRKFMNWLEILSNLGILAGLILVAVQIKQSTDIARAQLINESYGVEMQVPIALMGDDPAASWARAIHHPEELTDKDLVVVDALLTKEWLNLSRLEMLVDSGYAGGVDGPATFIARQYLRQPFGRHWWATGGAWTVAPAPRAREAIEQELKSDAGSAPSLPERYERLRAASE